MAWTNVLAAIKWPALISLAGLVLAVIAVQQDVEWLGILFAGAAGWFAHRSWTLWRTRKVTKPRGSRKRHSNGPMGNRPLRDISSESANSTFPQSER